MEEMPARATQADILLDRCLNGDRGDRSADTPAEAAKRLRRTMSLLRAVDQRTREIYIAYRSGYTCAEIAVACRVSHRTIKRCVTRALFALMSG